MHFPPELLDRIFGYFDILLWGCISLKKFSLVAKSWVYPSQRRIFETVYISERQLWSWLGNISPKNVELLGHIRSLTYDMDATPRVGIDPARRMDVLRDYLPSFRQLRSLYLVCTPIPSPPQQVQVFSAFQHTMSYFSLSNSVVTTSALVALVNYLPNLTHLDFLNLTYHTDDESIPPLSRPLLRKLSITQFRTENDLYLLDQLFEVGLKFDEVDATRLGFGSNEVTWQQFTTRVIDAFGANAQRLVLRGCPECMCALPEFFNMDSRITYNNSFADTRSLPTLSHCRELRELTVFGSLRGTVEPNLISSITSANISKITLVQSPTFQERPLGHTYWTQLDSSLCKLADQSKCKLRLEIELQGYDVDEGLNFRKYLPRFHEEGRVRILVGKTRLIYYSDETERR